MRVPKINPKYDEAFQNRSDLTQILNFSPIAPQVVSSDIAGPSGTQTTSSAQKQPTPILRKTSKRKITVSDTSDSDTSSIRKSKRTLKKKSPKNRKQLSKKSVVQKVTLITKTLALREGQMKELSIRKTNQGR